MAEATSERYRVGDLVVDVGAGAKPAAFLPIAQGETGGDGIALGPWDVRFVPEGVYTLRLVVTDRAGLSTARPGSR